MTAAEDPRPPLSEGAQPLPEEDALRQDAAPLLDALTDVAGIRVGHAQVDGSGR